MNDQTKDDLIAQLVQETSAKLRCKSKRKPTKSKQHSAHQSTATPTSVIFPHITRKNWIKFEKRFRPKQIDQLGKKLNVCLSRMHGSEFYRTHFTAMHLIRIAVVDALTNRKWDNLLRSVIILGRNHADFVGTPFIRHLCLILKRYHPAIRDTQYEEQLDIIMEKYKKGANADTVIS